MAFGLDFGGTSGGEPSGPQHWWTNLMTGQNIGGLNPGGFGIMPEAMRIYQNRLGQQGGGGGWGGWQPPWAGIPGDQNPWIPAGGGLGQQPAGGGPMTAAGGQQLAGHHMMPGGGQQIGPKGGDMAAPAGAPGYGGGMQSAAEQGLSSLLGASDVSNNPYLGSAISATLRPLLERYQDILAPGARGAANVVGQNRDSSRTQIAEGIMGRETMQQMADIASRMGSQAYGQGLEATAAGIDRAPTVAGLPYAELAALRGLMGGPPMVGGSASNQNYGFSYESNPLEGIFGGGR